MELEYYIGEVKELRATIRQALAALQDGKEADVVAAIEILQRAKA